MNRSLIRVSPALLFLAAGSVANAQFVFQPTCNGNWYGECSTNPCPSGGYLTFNNWGQSACTGGLALPGAGSTASIGSQPCYINGDVGVSNILMTGSSTLNIGAGLSVFSTCTTFGAWNVVASNNTMYGSYINPGVWTWQVGWNTALNNFNLVNNNVVDLQNRTISNGGGTNAIVNNAQLVKSTGNNVIINAIPITHQGGQLHVTGGTLYLDSLSLTTASPATYSIDAGTALYCRTDTLRGVYAGTNSGMFRLENCGVDQDTTFAITGNPIDINGNFSVAATKTLNNAGLLQNVNGNNTITGDIDNNGTFTHDTGWNTTLTGGIFVNNPGATLDLRNRTFTQGGGSSVINSGTVVKSTGAGVTFSGVPFTNNSLVAVTAGTLYLDSLTAISGAGSAWNNTGGSIYFRSDTLRGAFAGSNTGFTRIDSCTFSQNSTVNFTGNPLDINGDMAVSPGATLTNNGLLQNVNGNNSLYGTIVNNGLFTHNTGWNTALNGCNLTNNAGATFRIATRTFSNGGNSPTFTNNGTVQKLSPSDAVFSTLPFTNNAAVSIEEGRLFVDGSSVTSSAASTWHNPGGQLYFRSSTLRGTYTSNNAGFLRFENPTFDQNSILNVTGNGADINGAVTVTSPAPLVNNGLLYNVQGNNSFTGSITNNGTMTHDAGWSTGLINCTLTNGATGTTVYNTRTLSNGGGSSIVNQGLWRKATGAAAFINSLPFANSGSLQVEAGNLYFDSCPAVTSTPGAAWGVAGQLYSRSSTLHGTFNIANTGFVRLENSAFDQNSTFNCTGAAADINGSLSVSPGATLTNAGAMQNVNGNNGLNGNITNTGQFFSDSGWNTSIGSGMFTNAAAGTFSVNSRSFNDAGGGAVTNNGLLLKTGGGMATFSLPITNTGLIKAEAGRLNIYGGVANSAGGVVRSDAEVWFPGGYSITSGRYEGTGTFVAQPTVTVAGGRFAPGDGVGGIGTLTLAGNLAMTAGGTVEIDVAGASPSQIDKLNLSSGYPNGIATLTGLVNVNRVGGYIPTPGSRWNIMNFRERSGLFDGVSANNPVSGVSYRLLYTATSVDLLVLGSCGAADVGAQGGVYGPDGQLDNNDFIVFIDAFFNHDAVADIGVVGGVPGADNAFDNNDLIVFINAFFTGCQN